MKEIITFFISGREYGIEISGMQSLESYQEIHPLSEAPDCILGTIVVRDEVYPVYDLRAKLNLPAAEMTKDTKILLLRTRLSRKRRGRRGPIILILSPEETAN